LHDRAPLMCELGIGQLRYDADGKTQRLYIDGGFGQVSDNTVTILAQQAIPEDKITPDVIATAERKLQDLRGTDPETLAERRRVQECLSALRRLKDQA
jgi:F-type H+-transporting ATPase subunit epsilon